MTRAPWLSTGLFVAFAVAVAGGCQCGGGSGGGGTEDGGPGSGNSLCGNGVLDPGEQCDDGNKTSGDGCSSACQVETGGCQSNDGGCVNFGAQCGDGFIEIGEACDDSNTSNGDGCSATCQIEPGWSCDHEGQACEAAACGDGIVAGAEECDTGASVGAADGGCSSTCTLNPGWACNGASCRTTTCGDGVVEGLEQCDNGKHDWSGGCSPDCTFNPDCDTNGNCQPRCGDGILLPSEAADPTNCDDGNTRNGDGCSSKCKVEQDWQCTYEEADAGSTFVVPLVLRDFYSQALIDNPGNDPTVTQYAHVDFENVNVGIEPGIAGPLYALYDSDGKPLLHLADGGLADYVHDAGTSPLASVHSPHSYFVWYRDTPYSLTDVTTMTLTRDPATGAYVYGSTSFFPWDAMGWVVATSKPVGTVIAHGQREVFGHDGSGNPHDFSFTSEVRYWFQFKGIEKLEFYGDDNVWVFINHKLAVDIGGVHGRTDKAIDLSNTGVQTALGLTVGGIYEVVVFQAERHQSASNYELTLNSFEKKMSVCVSLCGNGHLDPGEECDDGNRQNGDGCSATCRAELN